MAYLLAFIFGCITGTIFTALVTYNNSGDMK